MSATPIALLIFLSLKKMKIVLITNSASGIGHGIAHGFAKLSYCIIAINLYQMQLMPYPLIIDGG